MTALVTPTDYELRAEMMSLIEMADADALVYPDWKIELVEGKSLNVARVSGSTLAHAAMLSLKDEWRTRVGDVPYEPAAALALKYGQRITRVYRFMFVRSYDDVLDADGKTSEQLFNEWLDTIVNLFSRSPKLGANARVESHDELQISNRRIPSYGGELAHTADGLLTVRLHQTVTPT